MEALVVMVEMEAMAALVAMENLNYQMEEMVETVAMVSHFLTYFNSYRW
jgi:septation ring formation regulator EzrA